jgi:hypothetical protein
MAKLIIHTGTVNREEIAERRLYETALLPPLLRFKKAFELMALSSLFLDGRPIKQPQGLGVVLKRK